MSHKKDQQRYVTMKHLNPDYKGFRGHAAEADQPGQSPLQAVPCAVCGRKRNVPVGVAMQQGERYVCQSCRDEGKE